MKTRIDEIKQMPRAQEFAELLVQMEPVTLDDLLIAFDDRVDESMPRGVIDRDELQGWDLFSAFTHCYDGPLMYDNYDWPAPRGTGQGYVRYLTDLGLEVFRLERRPLPDDLGEFERPAHRCDHENQTHDDPRFDGSLCLDCGKGWVGSFSKGWVG